MSARAQVTTSIREQDQGSDIDPAGLLGKVFSSGALQMRIVMVPDTMNPSYVIVECVGTKERFPFTICLALKLLEQSEGISQMEAAQQSERVSYLELQPAFSG